MLQTSAAARAHARPQPDPQDAAPLDPLLRLAGELRDTRVLVVAEHGLDLMCTLIRRGCLAATALRIGDKPDAQDYDLVLVTRAAALSSPDTLIELARRALAPNGRLIAAVTPGTAAVALARRLRLNGFIGLRSTQLPNLMLLRADLRRVA